MTTMNNEDPADPSVHEPRELPEPVAYLPAYELDRLRSGHTAMLRSAKFGPSEMDGDVPVYTADQMREAIAAERERQTKPPKWWKCKTHGDAQPNAWGCPECVREMRSEAHPDRGGSAERFDEVERAYRAAQERAT